MKRLNDNSVLRFVNVAVAMAEKATETKQLERLYNSGEKYSRFIAERMGTGAYNDTRYNEMYKLREALSIINIAVVNRLNQISK